MAAADAQLLWLSAAVRNDQFLLYAFDGTPDAGAVDELRRRAAVCDELTTRVDDDSRWRYPRWVRSDVADEQFVVHDRPGWPDCLAELAGVGRLDATRMPWRVHVYGRNVVVVQMSHALADGTRGAALAGALLGRRTPIPPVAAPRRGFLPWRAVQAARAHRGAPPSNPPRPALSVNARPAATPVLRTLLPDRDRLWPTVTIGVLVAVADALGGYCRERGEDVSRLGAEVPMAGPANGIAAANNNFRNVSVGLYPELAVDERARRIAADLDEQRRRGRHPSVLASAAAFDAVPAWLLRWGVGNFDPAARSPGVSGNTVVSSVNRGPADLSFGGRQVLFTAGFPALSPMQSLTHGVHGIGHTVAVSVHADPVNVDVDDYLARLADALGCQP